MSKELEIWRFAAEKLKRNESVMMLVVAESSGSSPGRQGFKMAVAADEICGSIGGGVMEVRLAELAKGKSEFAIVEQVHRKSSANSSGMICSGRQTVIFYRLDSSHLKTIREIIRTIENGQPKVLQISNFKFQISDRRAEDFDFKFEQSGVNDFIYREKLGFKNRLFIIGGGHCALALSELMSKMDFHISLFDDRPNLNTLEKNKFAHAKQIIESYCKIGEFIGSGANHFVVVMTLGYKTDEVVIRQLLDKKFKYFGVLGSRAKMTTLLKDLRKAGFAEEKLNRIRTPIGLPINSRTPEEIAVSIAAEIIRVKNSKD
ncbi:MAG: XdhC family protein [Acidobacteriota bacterium]|nr:XdhC family protein [Acidobacteriota bacterium]